MLIYKTWSNPRLKTIRPITPKTQHKNPEHMHFTILNTTNTIHGENCESSWVHSQFIKQEIYMCYLVNADRNRMAMYLTRSNTEGL